MPDDPTLRRVLAVLREPQPVRAEWRSRLEAGLARETPGAVPVHAGRPPAWPAPRWTLRPVYAIAAALAFMALGALGAALVLRRPDAGSRTALASPPPAGTREPVTVRFVLVAPAAHRVSVVGDFNDWDPSATPMRRSIAQGDRWVVELPVQPGRHAYAFYVDGDVLADPAAPRAREEDFGIPNSLLLVNGTP